MRLSVTRVYILYIHLVPRRVLPTCSTYLELLERALKEPQSLVARAKRMIPEASQLSAYGVALQLKGFVEIIPGYIVGLRLEEYPSTNKPINRVTLQG